MQQQSIIMNEVSSLPHIIEDTCVKGLQYLQMKLHCLFC